MNKTIEVLRKPIGKEDVLGNHIANTYFYQKTRHKSRRKNTVVSFKHLSRALIVTTASIVAAVSLITAVSFFHIRYLDILKKRFAVSRVVKIVERGRLHREFIAGFEFCGYARNGLSHLSKGFMTINNPKKYNWAALAIDFKFPLDLSSRGLALISRGTVGGERVHIILRDTNHRSVRLDDLYLSSKWRNETVSLKNKKGDIDLSKISHLRIESGYAGESAKMLDSPIDFKIYVKDLTITKEI